MARRSADSLAPEVVARALQDGVGQLVRRLRQSRPVADLAPPESQALANLVRWAPVSSAELARREGISPQSMGTTLSALERRGLVARRPDPEDGRRVLLDLTEAGRRKARDKRDARAEQFAVALARDFSASEVAVLAEAAPLLARLAEGLRVEA